MERTMLLQHLEKAERQIAEGNQHIAKQEALIAELARDGHDTSQAEAFLATLLDSQALHEQHRGTILRQLME